MCLTFWVLEYTQGCFGMVPSRVVHDNSVCAVWRWVCVCTVYPVNVQLFWHDTACFPPNSKQVCFYLFISVITEKMMISLHNCPEGLTRNVCLFENQDRPLPGKSFPCPKSSKYLTLSTYLETLMVSVEMDYFAES